MRPNKTEGEKRRETANEKRETVNKKTKNLKAGRL
jgi:hypothetical protein